jgi:glycerate dehydrogenase
MNIVVTDGYSLNPGDLSWKELEKLGDCKIYDRTKKETVERCKDSDIIVTNKVVLDKKIISQLPRLKCIAVTATGFNVVDTKDARERNIPVMNVPEYGTDSVSQMVFSLLLELCQQVGYHSKTVYDGRWEKSDNFCYWDRPLVELTGLTMGIVGCGRIGRRTAQLASAFGMKVLGYDAYSVSEDSLIEKTNLDDLLSKSDVVTLHCPLTEDTEEMMNAESISKMKNNAFFINTSRGKLVNERDLADALNKNKIAGAGLDVLSTEPPSPDNPVLKAKNCFITPHIAWATKAARERLLNTTIENIKSFINGKSVNVVN